MPYVAGRKFPYTKRGKKQAMLAKLRRVKRKAGRKNPYDYRD